MPRHILCVDIGGTQSRFAHMLLTKGEISLLTAGSCATRQIANTATAKKMAEKLTKLAPHKAHMQVWGIAGPVEEGGLHARLTNGSLALDFTDFKLAHSEQDFFLVNDFALQAFASLALQVPKQAVFDVDMPQVPAPRGILGAGTGLGAAALCPDLGQGWVLMPSEAGHVDMPLARQDEYDFAEVALKSLGQERLSAEDILCGRGLSLLHASLYGENLLPAKVAERMRDAYMQKKEYKVLSLYARFLGRFCCHWALNTLCEGGLYLSGGVLMKNPFLLQHPCFAEEFFMAPPHMLPILRRIPVGLMQHEYVGLWGAAYLAKNALTKTLRS